MEFKPYWVSLFITPIILRWVRQYAETAKAKRLKSGTIFDSPAVTIICGVSLMGATAIIVGGWFQDSRGVTTTVGVVWMILALWLWPSVVILDATEILSKHVLRRTRSIQYVNIDYVSWSFDGTATVYAKDGKAIEISPDHVDRSGLAAELKSHGVTCYRDREGPLG